MSRSGSAAEPNCTSGGSRGALSALQHACIPAFGPETQTDLVQGHIHMSKPTSALHHRKINEGLMKM